MSKKRMYEWRVSRIRSKGEYLGTVAAPDEKTALQKAIKLYGITDRFQQQRLLVLRNT
jgi:hypothetical protein